MENNLPKTISIIYAGDFSFRVTIDGVELRGIGLATTSRVVRLPWDLSEDLQSVVLTEVLRAVRGYHVRIARERRDEGLPLSRREERLLRCQSASK